MLSLNGGLIVDNEVHLLPATVFRTTVELQARRRRGLTAALVREDGRGGVAAAKKAGLESWLDSELGLHHLPYVHVENAR